jgi:hypothetical protein
LKKEFYRVIHTDEIINFTDRLTRSSTWSGEAVEPILQWIRVRTQDQAELTIDCLLPEELSEVPTLMA